MADDELEAIQAIYCRPGEIRVTHGDDGSKELQVRLQPESVSADCQTELWLSLPPTYPSTPPHISVRSNRLTRADTAHLRTVLCNVCAQLLDQPMLLDLITAASDELTTMMENRQEKEGDAQTVGNGRGVGVEQGQGQCVRSVCGDNLAVLHLDHMRAKTQYVKLIRKWAGELNLSGGLVFCQRLILILLQGSSVAIKDYIVRQRTSNVDVDSRGQPCKERMLSVLCDVPLAPHHCRFEDFQVVELGTSEDLKQFFTKWCLQDIYSDYVTSLKHFPGR